LNTGKHATQESIFTRDVTPDLNKEFQEMLWTLRQIIFA